MKINARFPAPRDDLALISIEKILYSSIELSGNSNHVTEFEQQLLKYM